MMRATFVAAAIVALALAGCGDLYRYNYPIAERFSPPKGRPRVFFGPELPRYRLRELAFVEAVGTGVDANADSVIAAMQDEAERYGADAIVGTRVDCGATQCHGLAIAIEWVPGQE
jgi:hypothetical protein